jgi:cytoskeletal protein RodZ
MDGEREHFGSFLRKQREARGMSIAELSRATKIKEQSLKLLEDAALDALPARVFVVGYIGAYARAVGADETEAMARLKQHSPGASQPMIGDCMAKVVARVHDETGAHPRTLGNRKLGMALVVFLLLIVATLTLSLLLRHGGHAGGAMS